MMLITEYPGANAIKFGQLYLKPSSLEETITHCCRMVLHEDDDRTLPLGRAGSATLVRYAGINYVIATRHEFSIAPGASPSRKILETIRIASGSDRLTNIPLKTCIFETSNPDQEYHDIIVFEAADNWENKNSDTPTSSPFLDFRNKKEKSHFW